MRKGLKLKSVRGRLERSKKLKIRSAPYNFPYAGYVNDGSLYVVGSYGAYWSRTALSSTLAYYLRFYSSNVYPASNYNRYGGFSIRCVATT